LCWGVGGGVRVAGMQGAGAVHRLQHQCRPQAVLIACEAGLAADKQAGDGRPKRTLGAPLTVMLLPRRSDTPSEYRPSAFAAAISADSVAAK
jgi:hypothetical protein